jgi:hypothetical protein
MQAPHPNREIVMIDADDKADEVPIPGVSGSILELVVNYMKEHKGIPSHTSAHTPASVANVWVVCLVDWGVG